MNIGLDKMSSLEKLTEDNIKENSKVTFEIEMGPKGANAINVRLTVKKNF